MSDAGCAAQGQWSWRSLSLAALADTAVTGCRWWAGGCERDRHQPASQQGQLGCSRVAFFFPYTDLTRVLMGRTTRK